LGEGEGNRDGALIGEDDSHKQKTNPDNIRAQFYEIPFGNNILPK
jgi:hypothetical protein